MKKIIVLFMLITVIIFCFTTCKGPTGPQGDPGKDAGKIPGTIVVSETGISLSWIPAGTFWMGSPDEEPGRSSNETRHLVTLTKGFYMGTYQVTQD